MKFNPDKLPDRKVHIPPPTQEETIATLHAELEAACRKLDGPCPADLEPARTIHAILRFIDAARKEE